MSDGYTIRGRTWNLSGSAERTPVLYLHGIQSHGGWYEWSGSLLAAQGHSVMMPDRRGSGFNFRKRGDVTRNERWLDDVSEHVAWLCKQTGSEQVAIVGVSWGGKLAASWAYKNPALTEKLLLIGPGIFPRVDLKWSEKCGVGAALIKSPGQYFPIPLNDAELFTSNKDGQTFIEQDELTLRDVTARFLIQSRKLDRELQRLPENALNVPICLLLSEKDRIIDNGKTRDWAQRVCKTSPLVVDFPAERHTLEFSHNREAFAASLERWSADFSRPATISG